MNSKILQNHVLYRIFLKNQNKYWNCRIDKDISYCFSVDSLKHRFLEIKMKNNCERDRSLALAVWHASDKGLILWKYFLSKLCRILRSIYSKTTLQLSQCQMEPENLFDAIEIRLGEDGNLKFHWPKFVGE